MDDPKAAAGVDHGEPVRRPRTVRTLFIHTLVTRHMALIRSAISKVARARASDIGEDVVQRVTIALWKRIHNGRPIEHPASYVYRCVIRETLRELGRLDDATSEPVDELLADSEPNPEDRLRGRELADAMARCLDELSPERALAVRAHIAGCKVDEIMERHAWSDQKARNLVARGMADLRKRLSRRGFAPPEPALGHRGR